MPTTASGAEQRGTIRRGRRWRPWPSGRGRSLASKPIRKNLAHYRHATSLPLAEAVPDRFCFTHLG
jgi:hypothetical protein